jgi:hypothetical protein
MQRNFDCPETDEACQDGRCTKALCCERERVKAAAIREAADKQKRIETAEVWETIGPLLKPKNSN